MSNSSFGERMRLLQFNIRVRLNLIRLKLNLILLGVTLSVYRLRFRMIQIVVIEINSEESGQFHAFCTTLDKNTVQQHKIRSLHLLLLSILVYSNLTQAIHELNPNGNDIV